MSHRPRQLYEFGPFVLDPAERTLLRGRDPVLLQPKVFDTLVVLVERGGRLVEKGEFMRVVWPEDEFVEEQNLNKNISKLRRALGEREGGAEYIETVPKSGYRFAAEVRTVGGGGELVVETRTRQSLVIEETLDGNPPPDPAAASAAADWAWTPVITPRLTATPVRWFGRRAIAAAVVVVVLSVAAYLLYPARRAGVIDSVAVLPFMNVGGDPEVGYLSDGVGESLIDSLSRLPGLKVIARSSSFQYKGREVDPREAGRALGVAAVLTGRVERRGERLFVSIELVDARDNTHVWGGQYSRKAVDLLQMQTELSREVAEALRLRLTAGERQQLARRETADPRAYELLLRGRFYWDKETTEGRKKAVEYYQQAIGADPGYALAYVRLFQAYSVLAEQGVLDPKEFTPKAREMAHTALELDDSLADAHVAVGRANLNAWDWAGAEREIRRAIELNPNLAWARIMYTSYLVIRGRHDEALAEARRAKELDPLSFETNRALVYNLLLAGQKDEAFEAVRGMLELDKSNPGVYALLGRTYAAKGQYPEAIAAFEETIRLGDEGPDLQVQMGEIYAKSGQPEQTRAIVKRLEAGKGYVSPAYLASLYAALGEREQAISLLERAYAAHDQHLVWLGKADENPVRSDPRFQDLLRRMNLEP